MGLGTLRTSIWDQGNQFLRKLLKIFDMEQLVPADIASLLEIMGEFKFLFEDKQVEVDELSKDVKIMILNAEQKKFCEVLKTSMEKETWTAIEFGTPDQARTTSAT